MDTHSIAYQVSELIPRLHKSIKSKYLVSKGVSSAQLIILSNLEANPQMSLKKLAAKIGVSSATASVAVDKLVKAGQIKRIENSEDRRKVNIILTASGKRKLKRIRKEIENFWFQTLSKSLNSKEQKTYVNILQKIVNQIENE